MFKVRAFKSQKILVIMLLALAAGTLMVAGESRPAYAATIAVNTTNDELITDGNCSLREAIQAANTDLAVDACTAGSGADTITVPAGTYTLTIGSSDAPLFGSHLRIDSDVTLSGAGAGSTIIEAGGNFRVFIIFSSPTQPVVTMTGLTIRNGKSFGANPGGGIYNSGTLTIDHSIISNNYADIGGGILTSGTLTITNSTIRDNQTPFPATCCIQGRGGGILSLSGGAIIISNSTVSGNGNFGFGLGSNDGTIDGGGIYSCNGCTLTMTNSTVSGNVSSFSGGGVWAMHNATITNSTITNNTTRPGPNNGAGIAFKIKVQNTIIANNSGDDCSFGTDVTSLGHNLSGDASCGFTNTGDLQNTNPLLGLLTDNGGPTETYALLSGSPAIDAGDDSVLIAPLSLTTDQRGEPRFQGLHVDIGSFELEAAGPTPVSECGTLSEPGEYVLANDIVHDGATSFSCIVMGANDITFSNPNGFTIKGDRGFNVGVHINSKTGVVVEGQSISDFTYGIFLGFGDITGTVVRNNNTSNNVRWGIRTNSTQNGKIINNVASGNLESGISLNSSGNFEVRGNNTSGNEIGINFNSTAGNQAIDNIANSNSRMGIAISGIGNVVTGNESNFNAWDGITFNSSQGNTVTGNTANSNGRSGIDLNSSDDNVVTGNITRSNTRSGINVNVGDRNTITGNTSDSNISVGINLIGTGFLNHVESNIVTANTIGILINSGSKNTILLNQVSDTSRWGIFVTNAVDNILTENTITTSGVLDAFDKTGATLQDLKNSWSENICTTSTPPGICGPAAPTQHTLDITVSGPGTVSGAGTYDVGTTADTSTVTPDPHATFDGWGGTDGADCADGSVTMDADKFCTATFTANSDSHDLVISIVGPGTVSGAGTYAHGDPADTSTVTLDPHATFDGWSGTDGADCADGSVTMDADKFCTATFAANSDSHDLTITVVGPGTVSGAGAYAHGDSADTSTITPNAGATFGGWTGTDGVECASGSVVMGADKSCTATFTAPEAATEQLIADVEGLGLPRGIENALVSKLEAALKSLEKGKDDTAVNQLEAFINSVEAQSGKKIDEDDADDLIAAAQAIIDAIDGG